MSLTNGALVSIMKNKKKVLIMQVMNLVTVKGWRGNGGLQALNLMLLITCGALECCEAKSRPIVMREAYSIR